MTTSRSDTTDGNDREETTMESNTSTASEAAEQTVAPARLLHDVNGIRVRTDNRAGGLKFNHAEAGVTVRTDA